MQFSLDDRTCTLSVGEFAGFTLGPRDAGTGSAAGVWRARLGQQWHSRLRVQTGDQVASGAVLGAAFEIPLTLSYIHRGWTFTFTGRVDQIVATPEAAIVREIKTVTDTLPADPAALRNDYPDYFVQVLAYLALLRSAPRAGSRVLPDLPGLEAVAQAAQSAGNAPLRAELVFVEVATGLAQTVVLTADDEVVFHVQLERLVEFLNLRLRARERLCTLRFRPAFTALRPGQETVQADLAAAFGAEVAAPPPPTVHPPSAPVAGHVRPGTVLFFEAPTGYGKTGVLLEFALNRLREGRFSRLLYLTGKSTGQLQVMRTLAAMTAPDSQPEAPHPEPETRNPKPAIPAPPAVAVAAWQVRPKSEHCVNRVFHCVRDACPYLADLEARWASGGLARFYLHEGEPHDLETLREAGRTARLCPYEITRAALPFNDVWVGDYNYVFSPDSRGVFYERPGFDPAETLLVVDEAHNLPARVADAWSLAARAGDVEPVLIDLHRVRAPSSLLLAWEHWASLLAGLRHAESLPPALEDDIRDAVDRLAAHVATTPLDYAQLGPRASEQLWRTLALRDWLAGGLGGDGRPASFPSLLWCPRTGELQFTCLDAAGVIGPTLRAFGGVVLTSATLQPADVFAAACGLEDVQVPLPAAVATSEPPAVLGKLSRRARRTLRHVTSGAALLQVEEVRESARPRLLQARTPWRDRAYTVGVDTRVDTTFQHRIRHHGTTAATVAALCRTAARDRARRGPTAPADARPPADAAAVFFPSYAYAESIAKVLADGDSGLRVVLQPRGVDLAGQAAWVEESLRGSDALFLVLGSGFAESIDLLGGRVGHAMVVAPALPEVNAIQRSRLAEFERAGLAREAAFRRVYQIPGMQKVNQALGRLVRAPGQRAKVLLHCRRFAEPSYAGLLAPEYRDGTILTDDAGLAAWLGDD